jgi:hypothetical protein
MFTQERTSLSRLSEYSFNGCQTFERTRLRFQKTNSLKDEISARLKATKSFKTNFIQENIVSIV